MVAGARDGTTAKPSTGTGTGTSAGSGGGGGPDSSDPGRKAAAADPRKLVRTLKTGMAAGELDKYVLRPSQASSAVEAAHQRGETERGDEGLSPDGVTAMPPASSASSSSAPAPSAAALSASAASLSAAGKRRREDDAPLALLAPAARGAEQGGGDSSGGRSGELIDLVETSNSLAEMAAEATAEIGEERGVALSALSAVRSVLSVPQWASGSKRAVGRASAARPFVPCELTSIHTLLRRETTNLSRGLQVRANEHTTLCPCGRRVPTRRPRPCGP